MVTDDYGIEASAGRSEAASMFVVLQYGIEAHTAVKVLCSSMLGIEVAMQLLKTSACMQGVTRTLAWLQMAVMHMELARICKLTPLRYYAFQNRMQECKHIKVPFLCQRQSLKS